MMELPNTEIPALAGASVVARLEAPEDEQACVLVVDDNPAKLLSLTSIISGLHLEVVTAPSGRAALRQLLERDFALILLDVNMPVMDGYETAQLIHGRPRSTHTPIIFITADEASEAERFRAYSSGAVDWIFSPIVPEVLLAKVRVFVDLYYLTRAAQRQAEELRQRAEEIERKNLQLEEASRLKSDFLASMSHELRTPLNGIIGFSELLRDGFLGVLSKKQKDAVLNINTSGRHLLSLINDILDLSKVEAGQMTLELETVAIVPLLASSLDVVTEKAHKQHIRLNLALDQELGDIVVDARKLKQIVFNLLSNAVKFTPADGEVNLAARRVRRAEVKIDPPEGMAARMLTVPPTAFEDFIEIKVSDTGISEVDTRRLFNTFVQLDSSLGRQFEGTGLGLALVRQMAALHGGTVGVASAPGQGSWFFVWLPWRVPDADAANAGTALAAQAETKTSVAEIPAEQPVAPAMIAASAAQAEAPRPLALVIEDNEQAAQILSINLESAGFRVVWAANVQIGLMQAAREPPALITLDLLLPGLSGWEMLQRIKADPHLSAVPVVIVSVAADKGHGYALGAVGVLQKPVARAEFLAMLKELGLIGGQQKPCVLVVDDDPGSVELVAQHLCAIDCNVVRAYSGRDAIATMRQMRPDLIILDLIMPDISGFDVIETLKSDSATADVPILILTAKDVTKADRERLNGYVMGIAQKSSFPQESFLREVARAMQKKDLSRHDTERG